MDENNIGTFVGTHFAHQKRLLDSNFKICIDAEKTLKREIRFVEEQIESARAKGTEALNLFLQLSGMMLNKKTDVIVNMIQNAMDKKLKKLNAELRQLNIRKASMRSSLETYVNKLSEQHRDFKEYVVSCVNEEGEIEKERCKNFF